MKCWNTELTTGNTLPVNIQSPGEIMSKNYVTELDFMSKKFVILNLCRHCAVCPGVR